MLIKLKDEFDTKYKDILEINDDLSSKEYDELFDELLDINSKMINQIIKMRNEYYHMPEPRI
jgi:hypothetical protein